MITCGRHLQNLDENSQVTDRITRALQEEDIQFVKTGEDSWDSRYPSQNFTPIHNAQLMEYDSTAAAASGEYHPAIYDLPVEETTGDVGLFSRFEGTLLKNITLSGARISGMAYAGGLAGQLSGSGSVRIENCRVALSPAKGHTLGKTEQDVWISGNITGGLVGLVGSSVELSVADSFAATVLKGSTAAGGLLGTSRGGTADVARSYADCYLFSGGTAGGLIGSCYGTSTIRLQDCYAAGFLDADTTAGLVAGEMDRGDRIWNVYSACAPLDGTKTLTYSTAKLSAQSAPEMNNRVFYLGEAENHLPGTTQKTYTQWSGERRAEAAAVMGGAFTAETGSNRYRPV